ncbi:MAG: hypothetical protein RLZZ09_1094 [Pseudomonadota bacterium]
MPRAYKPTALHFHHNADLSITIRSGGKKLTTLRFLSWDNRKDAMFFAKGWFGDHPMRIRETWATRFKSKAAA